MTLSDRLAWPLYGGLRYYCRWKLRKRCRDARALVLTYDDGPGPSLTSVLLDLFREHQAKATFFVLGNKAELNPHILRDLTSSGHLLASHSYSHLHPWRVSSSAAVDDIDKGFDALRQWHGARCFYRPPYGKLTIATWCELTRRKASICWWTIDSGDTWLVLPSPQTIAEELRYRQGGVVLLHDFDRGADRARYVVETTELLVRTARAEGMRIITVSELYEE